MAHTKLEDPADKGKGHAEDASFEDELRQADPARLDPGEVGSMPESAARSAHPFDGYPLGRKIMVEKAMVSSTHIVILRDPSAVYQDPSGKGVSHAIFAKDKGTKEDIKPVNADGKFLAPKVKKRTVIDLKTYHNRIVSDYDKSSSGTSMDWVFDRKVMVGDREMTCCIVTSHSARAQIFLKLTKKGKITIDRRYMLADVNQGNRLRRVFRNINYQQLKGERDAQKFDSDQSDAQREAAQTQE